jgi:hypothetical protein
MKQVTSAMVVERVQEILSTTRSATEPAAAAYAVLSGPSAASKHTR